MTKKKKKGKYKGISSSTVWFLCGLWFFRKKKYLIMCALWISLLYLPCIFTLEISVAVFAEHLTDDS